MNVEHQRVAQNYAGHLRMPAPDSLYRSLAWGDIVRLRAIHPKCNPTKAATARAAEHPESVFGAEIETFIGKTVIGAPTRSAHQAMALRRLAVLEDHEVTIDALRDTGLPLDLAIDLVHRLIARPTGWTLFERITHTPNLDAWARSVVLREPEIHVADDVLTLRILQTFGHDVSVPWSFDTTNKWVCFYSGNHEGDDSGLARLLDIATLDRPSCYAMRDACRKAYQALAHAHYGAGGQVWPHWEVRGDVWEIYPDPRGEVTVDDIVFTSGVTCDTERWLRDVTPVGCLDINGFSSRTGIDFESDLSDPDNVTCDPARERIAPGELRERLAALHRHRRAAQRAALPRSLLPPGHTDGSDATDR